MPKAPPVEYFEVTVRCPKEALGELMSDINKRGLTDVNFNLVTAVKTFNRNSASAPTDPSMRSREFLSVWLKDHPTFRALDVVKAFKADGRTAGAAYTVLREGCADGTLKKLGIGDYSRADVKALAAPKKGKKTKGAKKAKAHHEINGAEFALRTMRRTHGRMSSSTLKKHFESDGRVPTGVGPIINRLLEDKRIKRVGEGLYEIVAPKKTEPKKAAATNGAAAHSEAPGA
jgi:hypothetical protein